MSNRRGTILDQDIGAPQDLAPRDYNGTLFFPFQKLDALEHELSGLNSFKFFISANFCPANSLKISYDVRSISSWLIR